MGAGDDRGHAGSNAGAPGVLPVTIVTSRPGSRRHRPRPNMSQAAADPAVRCLRGSRRRRGRARGRLAAAQGQEPRQAARARARPPRPPRAGDGAAVARPRTPDAAANNFHQALYVARRALEAAGAEAPAVLAAARRHARALPGRRRSRSTSTPSRPRSPRARETGAVADLRAALALHGGELLPEDRYEPWAAGRREALSEAHLGLLLELAGRAGRGRATAEAAIEALEQAVVLDPLHEARPPRAHAPVRRGGAPPAGARCSTSGCARRSGASSRPSPTRRPPRSTARCCAARATATAPSGDRTAASRAPRRAARRRRPRRPGTTCRPRSRASSAASASCARSRRLLDRHRLLTLTGAGGAGKTRLAPRGRARRASARAPTASGSWSWPAWATRRSCRRRPPSALGLTLPSQRAALDGLGAQLAGWRGAARPRQLRAPRRAPARSWPSACSATCPGPADPGHEPRAPARRRAR